MKTQKRFLPEPDRSFKPFSITIIFDKQEEVTAIRHMASMNITIPDMMGDQKKERTIVQKFLGNLHKELL